MLCGGRGKVGGGGNVRKRDFGGCFSQVYIDTGMGLRWRPHMHLMPELFFWTLIFSPPWPECPLWRHYGLPVHTRCGQWVKPELGCIYLLVVFHSTPLPYLFHTASCRCG